MTDTSTAGHDSQRRLWPLALAALGIVYGDIGTSPLYALRECFRGEHAIAVSEVTVIGILSLVFWSLILVISIKYVIFVLRADNRGEGGILALTSLAAPHSAAGRPAFLLAIGIFGAALLYGDGVITPAISVLSAVEGLELASPAFHPFVLPLAVGVLILLFWIQKRGTTKIGAVFGPVMVLWFGTLAVLGINGIISNPSVLKALSPYYALDFFLHHRMEAYYAMGSLFLVVTGGESLYADMGHFGKVPIRRVWFSLVLPALVINYFGQGALLLNNPAAAENPFYLLAPSWFLIPLVILGTAAAVIASQALISGVFSLTRQAIQLGLCPRMLVVHTSSREIGQIYIPQINWLMLLGTLWLVISFKSSSGLAAAYGISVSGTMVITTIMLYVVARRVWKWSRPLAGFVMFVFLIVDLIFFSANVVKIEQGGYVPIFIAAGVYTLMVTWREGRAILTQRMRKTYIHFEDYLKQLKTMPLARVPGVAVFMVGDAETTPPAMIHNVHHNKVLHEKVILITFITEEIPTVDEKDRVAVKKVDDRIYRVIARYGFMDSPDIVNVIEGLQHAGLKLKLEDITFFLGQSTLIATNAPGMAIWRERVFAFMTRNAQRATQFFNIPADQVIEVGIQVEL